MAKIDVTRNVSKESYELGQGLAAFVGAVKEALADGWQAGTDIPTVISAAVTELIPSVQGLDQIDEEFAADKMATAEAMAMGALDIVKLFEKKEAPVDPNAQPATPSA